jgi:hypothetical protein
MMTSVPGLIRPRLFPFCAVILAIACVRPLAAQQSGAPLPQAPSATQSQSPAEDSAEKPVDAKTQAEQQLKQQESQRMLGVIPAFNEVMGGHAAPLRASQKFDLFLHSAFDPYQFVIVGLDAGIEQAEDQFPEYHYGIQGYSRRYLAAFGDNFDGNLWGNAILPSVLRQDPRYYRLGHGKVMHRILYSASTAVICKGDNGKWQPNVSNVAGNLIGGAISNFYYPAVDRGLGLTFERGLTVTATGTIGSLAEEFYPDVAAYFSRKHARKVAAREAAAEAAAAGTAK